MEKTMRKMLILPGITDIPGAHDSRGLLDRPRAESYARRKGREPVYARVASSKAPSEQCIGDALDLIRADETIDALYGFSGGGYNLRRVTARLTESERARIALVVVLGAPQAPPSLFRGPWELVWRDDPPSGHMDGPRVLLEQTPLPVVVEFTPPPPPASPAPESWGAVLARMIGQIAAWWTSRRGTPR